MSDDYEEEAVSEDYPNEGYIKKLEAALKTCRELREYDRAEIARLQAFIQGCATCKEEWEAERRRNYDEMQRRFRELG